MVERCLSVALEAPFKSDFFSSTFVYASAGIFLARNFELKKSFDGCDTCFICVFVALFNFSFKFKKNGGMWVIHDP